jgi:hypothetical protein
MWHKENAMTKVCLINAAQKGANPLWRVEIQNEQFALAADGKLLIFDTHIEFYPYGMRRGELPKGIFEESLEFSQLSPESQNSVLGWFINISSAYGYQGVQTFSEMFPDLPVPIYSNRLTIEE